MSQMNLDEPVWEGKKEKCAAEIQRKSNSAVFGRWRCHTELRDPVVGAAMCVITATLTVHFGL